MMLLNKGYFSSIFTAITLVIVAAQESKHIEICSEEKQCPNNFQCGPNHHCIDGNIMQSQNEDTLLRPDYEQGLPREMSTTKRLHAHDEDFNVATSTPRGERSKRTIDLKEVPKNIMFNRIQLAKLQFLLLLAKKDNGSRVSRVEIQKQRDDIKKLMKMATDEFGSGFQMPGNGNFGPLTLTESIMKCFRTDRELQLRKQSKTKSTWHINHLRDLLTDYNLRLYAKYTDYEIKRLRHHADWPHECQKYVNVQRRKVQLYKQQHSNNNEETLRSRRIVREEYFDKKLKEEKQKFIQEQERKLATRERALLRSISRNQ